MLKGSVRVPQCRGACSREPAAARAHTHTHTHTHTQTHILNTWILAYAAHNTKLYWESCVHLIHMDRNIKAHSVRACSICADCKLMAVSHRKGQHWKIKEEESLILCLTLVFFTYLSHNFPLSMWKHVRDCCTWCTLIQHARPSERRSGGGTLSETLNRCGMTDAGLS